MPEQPRWFRPSGIPIAAGVAWFAFSWHASLWAGLLALIPGSILLASGVSLLLWPGDRKIPHYTALGALISVPMALLSLFFLHPLVVVLLAALGVGSYLTAGYAALLQEPVIEGIPEPERNLRMVRKVALDEALLAYFIASARTPTPEEAWRSIDEVQRALELYDAKGWLDDPVSFHASPPPPDQIEMKPKRRGELKFQALSFNSGYLPPDADPGRDRWPKGEANRTAHAWVFRHPGPPRPWLVCIHGYRMGSAPIDFMLFRPRRLHHKLGLNLIMPILPLHGMRKQGLRSGDGFLDGSAMDLVRAEAQAVWDVRRCLAWVRKIQPQAPVGLLGYSLGGYNASLVASVEQDLQCVIAGIPLVDIADALWLHSPQLQLRYMESIGLNRDLVRSVLRVVSPLAMAPRVPQDNRFIFAGTGDRLVPPAQILRLWEHWQRPECLWYQGSHLSVRRERSVAEMIESALSDSGLTLTQDPSRPQAA